MKTYRKSRNSAFLFGIRAITLVMVMTLMFIDAKQVNAVITNYSSYNDYLAEVGSHEIITFTEVPVGTVLSNQYASQGVNFAQGDDVVITSSSFDIDYVGVNAYGRIELLFNTPQSHIGVDFPGAICIEIYDGSSLIGDSGNFGGSGHGFFGGIVSTELFNRAVLLDWNDDMAYIDNLHYESVPEPATMSMLLMGSLILIRKRK